MLQAARRRLVLSAREDSVSVPAKRMAAASYVYMCVCVCVCVCA